MKKVQLTLALGLAAHAAVPAGADFVGLSFEDYVGPGWVDNGFTGLTAWRLYADFDDPTDGLSMVFGSPLNPMTITSFDGAFFNSAQANSLTAPATLYPSIWSNQWDTYVTVGTDTAEGDETQLTPQFNEQVGGLVGSFTADNLSWYVFPGTPQGLPVDGRVLIGQFVVTEGVFVEVELCLQMFDGTQALDAYVLIPSPGTLGLLVIAGVRGRRRR